MGNWMSCTCCCLCKSRSLCHSSVVLTNTPWAQPQPGTSPSATDGVFSDCLKWFRRSKSLFALWEIGSWEVSTLTSLKDNFLPKICFLLNLRKKEGNAETNNIQKRRETPNVPCVDYITLNDLTLPPLNWLIEMIGSPDTSKSEIFPFAVCTLPCREVFQRCFICGCWISGCENVATGCWEGRRDGKSSAIAPLPGKDHAPLSYTETQQMLAILLVNS